MNMKIVRRIGVMAAVAAISAVAISQNAGTPAKSAAEAQLAQAEAAADRLNIRAPFAGLVEKVEVERGEWVQAGTPIATVLALDPIIVRAEVGELDIARIAVGGKATVRLISGAELDGTVRTISNESSAQTRTFAVDVSLPNPDRKIPSGMTAEVSLFTDPVSAVVVPRSVITLSAEGKIGLRVVGADNIARFVATELVDDTAEGLVVAGLPEGVRIITAGQDLVRDGETVTVVDAADQAGVSE